MNYLKVISLLFLFSSFSAFGIDSNSNSSFSCVANHLDTNKEVEVKIISAIRSKNVATAQWPLGYPTIAIDNSAFLKLPKNAQQFIYYHECAHLKFKIYDEFDTDCKSLDLIKEKHQLSEIDIRKLVETLVKEFGMSHRWSNLLQCDLMNNF